MRKSHHPYSLHCDCGYEPRAQLCCSIGQEQVEHTGGQVNRQKDILVAQIRHQRAYGGPNYQVNVVADGQGYEEGRGGGVPENK